MSDEPAECPLCMEPLEIDDHSFFPCTCGYQICRFCWHRIRTDENGLCPACRKAYPENPAEFKPLTDDELQNIKKERKQKDVQRKQKAAENRKHLANVRVVQRNLVFVVGLSPRLADPDVLKKQEYFGKFGKIHKVVINQSTSYAGSQVCRGPSASAYVTYVKPEDALRAILTVNNVHVDGRTLKTSLGTTKYCSHFLKGSHCQKNDCMYLHELGEEAASFTKDEMQAGKHQEYEQLLIEQFLNTQNTANNHVTSHPKLYRKKPYIENTDVIPSLMDMASDIKHTLPPSGPLLPNPIGAGCRENAQSSQSGNWPLLDPPNSSPTPGNGSKNENLSNGRSQGNHITSTPPEVGNGSRAPGAGRQRSNASMVNGLDDNHLHNSINNHSPPNVSNGESLSPSLEQEDASVQQLNGTVPHSSLPLPSNSSSSPQGPASPRSVAPPQASSPPTILTSSTSNFNGQPQNPLLQQPTQHCEAGLGIVGAIGSNRRSVLSETNSAQGLSFFSNSLLQPDSPRTLQNSSQSASQELTSVSLPNTEMADTLPVSSSTDWSAAFGFKTSNKELSQDDDLGFDPCAESFKGLADLIEKENGLTQSLPPPSQNRLAPSPPQSTGFNSPAAPPSPQQSNTQPPLRNLPPGFSISHIQQQQLQQQHFLRPEMSSSKMMELLPHFGVSQARFPPLHNFPSMPLDMQHSQQQQRDNYNMKDMQDQLRSMLPNINISFGSSLPQQQQQQPNLPQHPSPNSMHHNLQSQYLNKSWPLSSSPDSTWNDPAIVTSSQFPEPSGLFQESAPHWLKSLQQLTESDSPSSHRLPFVQQFPLTGNGGWPPHTHNPPPGFRTPGMPSQQATDTHQMAEVLQ